MPAAYGQSKVPDSQQKVGDFLGMVVNADPHDLAPGASPKQVNVTNQRPGELRVRGGYKELTFEA